VKIGNERDFSGGAVVKQRIQHIDVARGIGIILVVLGHNAIVIAQKGELFNLIYSFHIPLFLFLSGLFLNQRETLKAVIINKTDAILKPYFVTLVLGYWLVSKKSIAAYGLGAMYSTAASLPGIWVALWFLTHLWLISIAAWGVMRLIQRWAVGAWLQAGVLLGMLSIGWLGRQTSWAIPVVIHGEAMQFLGQTWVIPGLPFSLDILLMTLPFFLLGSWLKPQVVEFQLQPKWVGLSLALFSVCHYGFNWTIDFGGRRYDHLLGCTVQALAGIYLVLSLARTIAHYPKIGNALAYVGSGSLFVLMFHKFFQNRVSSFLINHYHGNLATEVVALIIGSTAPLVIWEIVRRNHYLTLLFLPLKHRKLIQAQPEPNPKGSDDR
jgi:polysaccharide biosynthesis protein PslL